MNQILEPIRADSLKDVFISRFEELILSGTFAIGQALPSERELALQLGVSRPVVHEGLVELAHRGLITMKPRAGSVVNDYRRQGSLALLQSLIAYHNGGLDPALLDDVLAFRRLVEVQTAREAARQRTEADVDALFAIVEREEAGGTKNADEAADLDFEFHLAVAIASGNAIYPLLFNSFKPFYTNLSGKFFALEEVGRVVYRLHRDIAEAIRKKDARTAGARMLRLLNHGAKSLKATREG